MIKRGGFPGLHCGPRAGARTEGHPTMARGGWCSGTQVRVDWGPKEAAPACACPPRVSRCPGIPAPSLDTAGPPCLQYGVHPPRGSFGVGACGGDMGYGACHDQLGDRPLVSYLVPLLASVSFVPCTWGRGVGSVFFEAGQFCVGLGPGWHVPSLGCLAAPIGSSFGSGLYTGRCVPGALPGPAVPAPSLFWIHPVTRPSPSAWSPAAPVCPTPGRDGSLASGQGVEYGPCGAGFRVPTIFPAVPPA